MRILKEGDIVEWGGVCGTVLNKKLNYGESDIQYVLIDFKTFGQHYFLEDGRQSRWQTKPVLELHTKSETFEIPVVVDVTPGYEKKEFYIEIHNEVVIASTIDISKVKCAIGTLTFTLTEEE